MFAFVNPNNFFELFATSKRHVDLCNMFYIYVYVNVFVSSRDCCREGGLSQEKIGQDKK